VSQNSLAARSAKRRENQMGEEQGGDRRRRPEISDL